MICLRHVLFLSVVVVVVFLFLFLSMSITEEHGTHRFYDVSKYSQLRPWLLDKLRWTQAIVTALSHFLVLNRVRILRIGQHIPTKNFQEYPPETWSLVASFPVSIHLLIMHQSIPAGSTSPSRATAGHLPALSVPGVRHLQILRCPGPGPAGIGWCIIRCFNDLWPFQHHHFGLSNRRNFCEWMIMKLKMAVLSPLPHNYTWHTAEHRKQRFEVRASTPSAKSTLMMNSNLVPRPQSPIQTLGVNTIPSRFINSIVRREGFARQQYHPSPLSSSSSSLSS